MAAIADRLRDYTRAISDPSRGMILVELDRAGELTATQLARRIGLSVNNIYHHVRVLLEMGLLDPPRVVPGDTYVEKYYHVNPDISAALRLDPTWYDRAHAEITPEERKLNLVSTCLTMAHLLRRAAQQYQRMDPEDLDRVMSKEQLIMLSIRRMSREELQDRMLAIQTAMLDADPKWAEDTNPRTDHLLIAALSLIEESDGTHG